MKKRENHLYDKRTLMRFALEFSALEDKST